MSVIRSVSILFQNKSNQFENAIDCKDFQKYLVFKSQHLQWTSLFSFRLLRPRQEAFISHRGGFGGGVQLMKDAYEDDE